jgi:hypothetical protein
MMSLMWTSTASKPGPVEGRRQPRFWPFTPCSRRIAMRGRAVLTNGAPLIALRDRTSRAA